MGIIDPEEYACKMQGKDFDILISAKDFLFDDLHFLEWDIREQEKNSSEVEGISGIEYANKLECLSKLAALMSKRVDEFVSQCGKEAA